MDFTLSPTAEEYRSRLLEFMDRHVYPAELRYAAEMAAADDPHQLPAVLAELKNEARSQGLWNLFLPDKRWGAGLSVLDYAPLAEITGRSPHLAPEALNCSAPDTGNMEILSMFGTEEQQKRWLTPLLDGDIRSCFSMTEPDVASSDATNIRTSITRQGDEYVIDGLKWFSSGALNPRCRLSIVMGVTNPEADSHRRQSMILVPLDTPGVEIERDISVYGYHDRGGHAQIRFEGVRVPATNLLGEVGSGFAIAQARLGPGRIHHCMRALGMAERALELMCRRAADRAAFGVALADQGVVQGWIAESRIMIEQARLLVFKAAWLIDNQGSRQARTEIAAIKVVAPRVATWVLDRAVQLFGAAGVTADFPLAQMWSHARGLQIADGPDEVHLRTVARVELGRHREGTR
ncbi:MAG TPA: acyl-CoA dehydrogenase family protein [Acidimicrobiia bacterium]|nr:acyl-CoA dehydrogenase family protein [Acidimicrobiia bacterium]